VPLPLRSAGFIEPSKSVSQWRLAEAEGAIFFTRFLPRRLPPSRLVFTRHQTMAGYWQLNSIFRGIRGTGLMALLLDDSILE